MILSEEGKKEFLKTKFHQFIDITLANNINNIYQSVNFVLPLENIENETTVVLQKNFFNDEFNNVVFTAFDDYDSIYKYEFYKNRFFIKLKPFSKIIRMHFVPKKYDASNAKTDDNILFFKDQNQTINSKNFSCTAEYTRRNDNTKKINSRYEKTTEKPSNAFYKFDIKKYTKNINNLQINLGYSYNNSNPNSNPLKNWHLTGILDESDETGKRISQNDFSEFNSSLVDVNSDTRLDKTNKIVQSKIKNNEIDWDDFYIHNGGFNHKHTINANYHKTLKYFNDDLYIEENGQYHIVNWIEINEE